MIKNITKCVDCPLFSAGAGYRCLYPNDNRKPMYDVKIMFENCPLKNEDLILSCERTQE